MYIIIDRIINVDVEHDSVTTTAQMKVIHCM